MGCQKEGEMELRRPGLVRHYHTPNNRRRQPLAGGTLLCRERGGTA